MKQVKINIICLQPLQLFFKNTLGIVYAVNGPQRQLGCQEEGASVILFQHLAHQGFAFPVMVRISGVDIVYAGGNGFIQHSFSLRFIYFPIGQCGKTHASKPQQRCFNPQFFQFSLFHLLHSFLL